MPREVYLGFDFGYKRIGVAVGQKLTCTASALSVVPAIRGVPNWMVIRELIVKWQPQALIVGLPTCINDKELYTTAAARRFANELHQQFSLPVHLVDERLSTVEAREQVFSQGGYRQLSKSQLDCIAACVILEQWLHHPHEVL